MYHNCRSPNDGNTCQRDSPCRSNLGSLLPKLQPPLTSRCEFITQMRAGWLALLVSVPTALGLLQYDTYCDVLCNGHGRSAVRITSSAVRAWVPRFKTCRRWLVRLCLSDKCRQGVTRSCCLPLASAGAAHLLVCWVHVSGWGMRVCARCPPRSASRGGPFCPNAQLVRATGP
jgi:hypothetical protein